MTTCGIQLTNGTIVQGGQGADIDLSSYLPNDGFAYECWFNFIGSYSSGICSWMSGNNGHGSPIQYLTKTNSNNSSNNVAFRSIIGQDRKIGIFLEPGTSSSTFMLWLNGYRKIYPL